MNTDNQLKQTLAKMLPEKLDWIANQLIHVEFTLNPSNIKNDVKTKWFKAPVLDTELLHLCWLVEETLEHWEKSSYHEYLNLKTKEDKVWQWHATWQQRTITLARVKGIEI